MLDLDAIHAHVAARRLAGFASVADFRSAWSAAVGATAAGAPIEAAIVGGALADRLGYAFAAGYASALRRLVPDVAGAACLCVTEEGGAHPRAIRTALRPEGDGFVLTGRKQWSTLADQGDVLLVAASEGSDGDRNRLRLVRVDPRAPGVTLSPMPETAFTPEIPHFTVTLAGVRVAAADVLPGDGWERWIKPFRTVEDVFVTAAAAAYLDGVARVEVSPHRDAWPDRDAPADLIDELRALAAADPDDPDVHVRLGETLDRFGALVRGWDARWDDVDPEVAFRWRRDAPLLSVAGRARQARLEAARKRLGLV